MTNAITNITKIKLTKSFLYDEMCLPSKPTLRVVHK